MEHEHELGHELGLRERKKLQMRRHLADTAARLFATHGFDQVSMLDVAQAAEVSDQTVYNYFPAKHDLVLDRAEEIRERYNRTIRGRSGDISPAEALRPLAHEDINRFRHADLALARGEFPALNVSSDTIRRFALEMRDQQTQTITAAILDTSPTIHPAIVQAHAAALVSVFQQIVDRIGHSILDGAAPNVAADDLAIAVDAVLDDLDRHFRQLPTPAPAAQVPFSTAQAKESA